MSDSSKAVFLSYASQDAEAAKKICEALRAAGVEVWLDQSELVGGDAWDAKIRRQIQDCALFVPIISANTQARLEGYFRLEWKLAAQRTHAMADEKAFLLPVVIDAISDAEARVPVEFRGVQWIKLNGAEGPLTSRIQSLLTSAPGMRANTTARPPSARAQVADEKSVAVLAFVNLSRDPDNEYFSDGVSEELLNVLAKVPGLKVSARTSAFSFKGRNVPIPEVARHLGVAYVVEGSVRKVGNRVRITAQLIKAADGFHVWSDNFDRELQDIFAVQDEIAGLIAAALSLRLMGGPRTRIVDPEAHRLVMEGRHFWNLRTDEAFTRAEAAYERALAIDPDFAEAHAGLANVLVVRAWYGSLMGDEAGRDFARGRAEAQAALASEPKMAEPWAALGVVEFNEWKFVEAERAFQTALRLNPNYSYGHHWHAHLLMAQGWLDESLVELERAIQLDPLSLSTLVIYSDHLMYAGRYADALAVVERALAFTPYLFIPLQASRSLALFKVGRKDEGLAAARLVAQNAKARPRWMTDAMALITLREAGQPQEASDLADQLLAQAAPIGARATPGWLAAVGRTEEALAALAKVRPSASAVGTLYYLDDLAPLRQHPRFLEIVTAIGCREDYERARAARAKAQKFPG